MSKIENNTSVEKKFLTPPQVKKRQRGHPANLSSREVECLFYISRGFSVKEIARALDLSPKTVEQYLEHLRFRLDLSLRSDLVKFYFTRFEGFRWQ